MAENTALFQNHHPTPGWHWRAASGAAAPRPAATPAQAWMLLIHLFRHSTYFTSYEIGMSVVHCNIQGFKGRGYFGLLRVVISKCRYHLHLKKGRCLQAGGERRTVLQMRCRSSSRFWRTRRADARLFMRLHARGACYQGCTASRQDCPLNCFW